MGADEPRVCRNPMVTETALNQYREIAPGATRAEVIKLLKGVTLAPGRAGWYVFESGWVRFLLSRRNAWGQSRGSSSFWVVKVEHAASGNDFQPH